MLGDACAAAGLGDFEVELLLADSTRLTGTPSPQPADGVAVDETGYASELRIDGTTVELEEVTAFSICFPEV